MRAGLLTGRGVRIGQMTYREPARSPVRSTHGVNAMVGPTGSGKSLLVVLMARAYYEGRARDPATGMCVCRESGCEQKWTVYANMKAPARKEKGRWTTPLDVAGDLLSSDSELSHAVIILDEGYQTFDSRRSMRTENVKIANQLSQIRKHENRLFISSPSIDSIDRRIRQMIKRVYNCWSPDEGRHVCAAVHELNLAHLPPWLRDQRPELRRWYTAPYWKYYDSWEQIRDDEDLGSWKTEPGMFMNVDGQKAYVYVRQLIFEYVARLVELGQRHVEPKQMAEDMSSEVRAPVAAGYVRKVLMEEGFPKELDDEGRDVFVLLADNSSNGAHGGGAWPATTTT